MAWNKFSAFLLLLLGSTLAAAEGYRPSGTATAQDTYIFGIHPYANPQDLFDAYEPIMRYLEHKVPGARFQVEGSRSYADYEAKLAARRFHFGLPNPAQTVMAIDNGYKVIAKMTPDDDFRGLLIARADRTVATPKALVGKSLCFTSATAVAGTMLPLLYLHDNGVDVNKDIQVHHVGSQFSSILNALTGDHAACGSTVRFWRTWARDNVEKAKMMKVLWRTPPLPHNGVIAATMCRQPSCSRSPPHWPAWTRTKCCTRVSSASTSSISNWRPRPLTSRCANSCGATTRPSACQPR